MYVCMYVCMDGWMDGWMDKWMDVWMYGCSHLCTFSGTNIWLYATKKIVGTIFGDFEPFN